MTNLNDYFDERMLIFADCIRIDIIFPVRKYRVSRPLSSFKGSAVNVAAYGVAFYQGLWAYDGW